VPSSGCITAARSPEETAFLDDLAILAAQGQVRFHHDGGNPANGLDIAAALREYALGTHLYYCGPPGMMAGGRSRRRALAAWNRALRTFHGANAVRQ